MCQLRDVVDPSQANKVSGIPNGVTDQRVLEEGLEGHREVTV